MRYGFVVPNNFGVEDPLQVARLGERPYYDALVMLTWIAAHTSRVRLGTSVLVIPYLHPMVLAKELATLDHLSGGRLVVGVGVGRSRIRPSLSAATDRRHCGERRGWVMAGIPWACRRTGCGAGSKPCARKPRLRSATT